MQTLRKKGSPCKYRNDPGRFFGEGVVFKAKLIGILEVGEARGDRMCQEALQDLKMAIRAAGEHKQRITIHVTIDGLRLRDEKTGDSLYHHPVHKISFIAQDMTDSRAFGYIFGSPDSGHRFFGIKTDKAASQVVLAMRDLFQVVFELKKKEIELARQTIQTKAVLGGVSGSGHSTSDKLKAVLDQKFMGISKMGGSSFMDETSFMSGASGGGGGSGGINSGQMGDLVDLEQELSSIQRGITQMEKMTPNEGLPNKLDSEDPFGDSFATPPPHSNSSNSNTNTQFNILPPPPESAKGSSRQAKGQQQMAVERRENDWSPPLLPPPGSERTKIRSSSTSSGRPLEMDRPSTISPHPNSDWLSDEAAMNSLFESGVSGGGNTNKRGTADELEREFLSGRSSASNQQSKEDGDKFADAFIDLDPLGTGKNKPYVDKKFFFQDVKNPPKKVLKELSSSDVNFIATFQSASTIAPHGTEENELNSSTDSQMSSSARQRKVSSEEEHQGQPPPPHRYAEQSMFHSNGGSQNYFEPFEDPFELVPKVEQSPPPPREEPLRRPSFNQNHSSSLSVPLKVILPPETNRNSSRGSTPRNRSPNLVRERGGSGDGSRKSSYESTRRVRQSPDYDAPEPPPRPDISHYAADPPPLPPKKVFSEMTTTRTSNRPSLGNFKLSMSSPRDSSSPKYGSDAAAPPLPLPSRRVGHTESKYPGPERPHRQEEDGYLMPTSPNVPVLLPPPKAAGSTKRAQKKYSGGPLSPAATSVTATSVGEPVSQITEITLSQLLQLSLDELADKLSVSVQKLSTMTIVELTKYLSEFLTKEKQGEQKANSVAVVVPPPPRIHKTEANVFKVSFDDENKDATFVAVFDDNFGEEEPNDFVADFDNANIQLASASATASQSQQPPATVTETSADRYAVFREIFDEELKTEEQPDLLSGEDIPAATMEDDNEGVTPVDEEEEEDDPMERHENVIPVPPRIDTSITATISQAKDRYAALRDIVLVENLFEATPPSVVQSLEAGESPVPDAVMMLMADEAEPTTMMSDDNFVSDNFGDFEGSVAAATAAVGDADDEDKTITSSHINVESPEEDERTDYELKDKSCTPTFVSARDDLEIDELMNLAVSNLSLNNINSLSPKEMQLKHASTSPILRGQGTSPNMEQQQQQQQKTIDTSTSPIIMQMLSPVAFDRSSPKPPITVVTPPPIIAVGVSMSNNDQQQELVPEEKDEVQHTNGEHKTGYTRPDEKWTAFEESNDKRRQPGPILVSGKPPLHTVDQHLVAESPCSSDDKDELKVLNRKWPKGHTSSSSRDASPREPSPWDDEFGEGGRRRVSPGLATDRQGHYMRHGRRMDSCDDDYENEYEARESVGGGRRSQGGHYSKYGGDRGNWQGGGGSGGPHYEVDRHREAMKIRSGSSGGGGGRSHEKRKFYSSHGRKTYDYGDVGGGRGSSGGEGGGVLPFDIGAPVRAVGGGVSSSMGRDRIKREYYGSRERRSFDRESNDSYDSGSGGGGGVVPVRKPRREYRNEYYGSIELMPDEYELDVNKKRYASLEKGHKSSSRRSSSRRSNSDAYDDQDESEEGECPSSGGGGGGSGKVSHYSRPYLTEGTKSLQRGMNRQQPLPSSGGKSRKGGGSGVSSPWDSKPSPIYNNKMPWSSSARPSSASEAADRHRYYSTQALSVGCSDNEKERRQRLKGGSRSSSSTVQLAGPPQSAGNSRRYGSEFTFEGDSSFHGKSVMRKSLRGSRDAPMYPEELKNRKLNISSVDHPRYERTNSRPQPMEGKYYQQPHPQRSEEPEDDDEEYQHPHYHGHHGQQQSRRTPPMNEEEMFERRDVEEEQGFESDFIASSPVKSAGSLKNRPIFRFSTDYSNNNSPGVESSASGGAGGQNGSQPKLRFNEKVRVSNYKTSYLEDKSDSLESPPGSGRDQFEDDFSNLTPMEHIDEMSDQWDENFTAPGSKSAGKEKDIRKSESVNIFAKKSDDPFEDDDFFKASSGAGAEEQQQQRTTAGEHFNWNHNFAKFEDNI